MSYIPTILTSGTASAVASLTIDLSSYYNVYNSIEVDIYNLQSATDNVNFTMLVSTDGTTFDNASGNYQWQYNAANASPTGAASGTNSATMIQLMGGVVGSGALASAAHSAVVKANNLSSTTLLPIFKFETTFVTTGAFLTGSGLGSGTRTATQITKALRFQFSSGNITTASYRVIGIK